jgi:xanthine dehydrogenase accessory factor
MGHLPICLVCRVEGDVVAEVESYTTDTVERAGEEVAQVFSGAAGSTIIDDLVVSVFRAVPQLIIVGDTPVASALAGLAGAIGWQAHVVTDAASATGRMAGLSSFDKVVVAAHQLELAGTALMAALDSDAGYIGALGSRKMQENRADWLAYRGVTDLTRLHGPAGLDIGAVSPEEIAVSILAEAIYEGAGRGVDRQGSTMESARGAG